MDKEDVVYMYIIECYSVIKKKNEITSFAAIWVDLEIIILSEARKQKTSTI